MRQHRRLEQQRQHLALLGLPVNFRRGQREFVLDADLLGDGLGHLAMHRGGGVVVKMVSV